MKRRILAWIMTFMIVFGTMPNNIWTASAATENSTAATGESLYKVTNPDAKSTDETGGIYLDKKLSALNNNGEGTITLETYVTGTVHTETVPVDIVMVLDMSTSMKEEFSDSYYEYNEVYSDALNQRYTYYVKYGSGYRAVTYCSNCEAWTYGCSGYSYHRAGTQYTPKASATAATGTQFYSRTTVDAMSRLDALKSSASNFVDSIADRDEGHRIAIVGFHDYGVYLSGTNAADSFKDAADNAGTLKSAITGIVNSDLKGATDHNDGLELAEDILAADTQTDRNKVVILFTDGEPEPLNSGNWSSEIVKGAVNSAYSLKNTYSAQVYVISVLPDADPTDTTSNMDKYMNYVSSNYLNAQYTGTYSGTNKSSIIAAITPGTGSYGDKYYQVASSFEGLEDIFESITDDVQNIALDENTIVRDVMSEYFETNLPEGTDLSEIKVYESDYLGNDSFETKDQAALIDHTAASSGYTVSVENGVVSVKGFDFEPVIEEGPDGQPHGKKLIIEIPVKVKDDQKVTAANTANSGKAVNSNNTVDLTSAVTNAVSTWDFNNPEVEFPVVVSGNKVWNDESDRDGSRPDSITINLLANGEVKESKTVTGEGDIWSWNFPVQPKYDTDGNLITYSVTEENVPAEYTSETVKNEDGSYTVTNSHTPAITSVSVEKVWDDADNQDGLRPQSVQVQLYKTAGEDGTAESVGAPVTLTGEKLTHTWEDLLEKESGTKITYSVDEIAVPDGYTKTVTGNAAEGFTITNTHAPEKLSFSVTKVWEDNNDDADKRTESINVQLKANGENVGEEITLNSGNNWRHDWTDLDKYESGALIEYTVVETSNLETLNYSSEVTGNTAEGFTITNSYPAVRDISVAKVWNDADNQDGIRPANVKVQLKADGKNLGDAVTVTDTHTWENLFKYRTDENGDVVVDEAGKPVEISYTVEELDVPENYTAEVTGTMAEGFTITNTHIPAETSVSVEKVWDDNDDQDGLRPESITVNLLADGQVAQTVELGAAKQWTHTWNGLAQKKAGQDIEYTVEEVGEIAGYAAPVITGSAAAGYVITNTHTPETTEITGSKTWNDDNNRDGIRPESVTINLLADGVKVDSQEVKPTADGNWKYSFTNLNKYNNGKEIVYTVTEAPVEGYTATFDGFNVTNTHSPEKVSVEGTKTWDDADNQDGVRPESITVNLLADGVKVASQEVKPTVEGNWKYSFTNLNKYNNGKKIVYKISEDIVKGYVGAITGTDLLNDHDPLTTKVEGTKIWSDADNQDGKRPESITINLLADGVEVKEITLTEETGWEYKFENLPVFEAGKVGHTITYTITEDEVADYTTSYEGTNVINTHIPETVAISGTKTWDDADNQDGKRPQSITVNLLADGEVIDTKEVHAAEDGTWKYDFGSLPKYKKGAQGQEIVYTITENDVEEYTAIISGYDVTNRHIPETVEVSGSKTWNDNNDQDGVRPDEITIKLLANGEVVKTETVTAEDGWKWSFTELDKYSNGQEIIYTVQEEAIEGYTTEIDGYNVTNTYNPEQTSVNGAKKWLDGDNQDGVRPESITIRLLADGKEVADKTVTAKDNWAWSFTELPKYRDGGQEIVYTITEDEVGENYVSEIDGFNVTNTRAPELIDLSGSKTWNDESDRDGKRPQSITVRLLADGEEVANKTVTEADGWAWTFEDMPKFKAGKEIVYTVTEDAVEGYTAETAGLDVTNTHEIEKISLSGVKTWDDADDQDGKRPQSITIRLLADGKEVAATIANEASGWKYEFKDLPKYRAGKVGEEIIYTITEDKVAEYTSAINGLDVTNTHIPETVTVEGAKTWNDADNQDGVRPESITVNLHADGKEISEKTVSAADNWAYQFKDLPKYKDGKIITYTVTEEAISGYNPDENTADFNIENRHTPAKTSVTVSKVWKDANNQDGFRPESVTVRLLADGNEISHAELNEANSWTHTWAELDEKAKGENIVYTVSEDQVAKYTAAITGTAEDGYTVTNTHIPETVTLSGEKTWADAEDQDGVRPENVTINLLANGIIVDSVTVDNADDWKWAFADKPKYENGEEIDYVIQEVKEGLEGSYNVEIGGFDVTNTHIPETTSVHVAKNWNDDGDRDGIRPDRITYNLLADGEVVQTKTVTAADEWAAEFANLPVYRDGGIKVVYTVEELAVDGYVTTYIKNGENNFTVSNTHEVEKTSVKGKKSWKDMFDQDGKRPDKITVYLYANGERVDSKVVTADGDWKYEFTNLNKNAAGEEIVYTVKEEAVPYYSSEVDGTDIVNTYEPETVDISGAKTWADADDQDGKRPESITVRLLADGKEVASEVVTEAHGWTYTFEGMPKYKNGGKLITYTISEDKVAEYTTEINGYDVTNTHTPETTKVEGTKTWADENDQDGKRPESITINLLADGEKIDSVTVDADDDWSWSFTDLPKYEAGKLINYAVSETAIGDYSTEITNHDVTNTHTPEQTSVSVSKAWDDADNQDGIRPAGVKVQLMADGEAVADAELNADNNWAYTWSGLDMYNDGETIDYTVKEADVPAGYEVFYAGDAENGYVVTNKHTPATVIVDGNKTWADVNDQDGKRPEKITVLLLANGIQIDSVTISGENGWEWAFEDLPKFEDGSEIDYQIEEVVIEDYETNIDQITGEITNRHDPELTFVQVAKSWQDNYNQDGIRPDKIRVNLLADGKLVDSKYMTAADEWTTQFTNLPKYKDGELIKYTVTEDAVKGYETSYVEYKDYQLIVNTHEPETTKVEGLKTWADNNDQDGIRPDEITVNLYADGEKVDSAAVTGEGGWKYSFDNLPKFKAGKEIVYTIDEVPVKGYEKTVDGFNITNSHNPDKINIKGTKHWADEDDQDGKRPESITVQLRVNGQVYDSKVVTAEDNWTYEWKNLSKYYNGVEVKYMITEIPVPGYKVSHDGYDITNSYVPGVVGVHVTKGWKDLNDQDGIRPDSVDIELFADGVSTGKTITLNHSNGWHGAFTDLDEYADGEKIKYTVKEVGVAEGYTSAVTGSADEGYTVLNTHDPEKIEIKGTKTWDDADDQDGKRPESITVKLLANGSLIDTKVVTAEDNWTYNFGELNKYYNKGKEIRYEVVEEPVEGYETTVDGLDITNTHKPETTEISGSKTWDDNFDQDGIRPESITVKLLADGEVTESVKVTEKDGWSWTFENLPVYADGEMIEYEVLEGGIDGYETAVEGFDITNTHEPETTEISGSKTWDDADDQDGIRPEEIKVRLLADGKPVAADVASEGNNWSWSFKDVPVYADGEAIEYTVEEETVDGYKPVVNGFDITNTHKPETTVIEGTKTWDDADNQDGIRPEVITINLLANGKIIETAKVTVANAWTWTFKDMPVNENGEKITYTIEEEAVEGYTSTYDGFDVTNTHEPATVDVEGSKTWNDADNQDGIRPESITVRLLADGTEVDSVKVTAADEWSWSFRDLPEFKDGKEIVYTITEDAVEHYGTSTDGFDLINSYTPEQTSVTVTKAWADANDKDGVRPELVEVQLYADGEAYDEPKVLYAENNWTYTWTELDMNSAGEPVEYTVKELNVDEDVYTCEITGDAVSGYIITNKHTASTSAAIGGMKVLKNAELTEGQFGFGLYSESGEMIGTAVNGADGTFVFEEITYSEEGTYEYFIKEMIPEDAEELEPGTYVADGILYDTAVYKYTVTVAEEDECYAVTSEMIQRAEGDGWTDCETVEFTNEDISGSEEGGGDEPGTEEPGDKPEPPVTPDKDPLTEEDKDGAVQTGDNFNLFFWMMLALAGVFGAGGAVAVRRREN